MRRLLSARRRQRSGVEWQADGNALHGFLYRTNPAARAGEHEASGKRIATILCITLCMWLKIALPLYPQFGTEPNGYYIPPRWVPLDYLQQMFGPGVDEALERYANPDRELLAVMQLFRRSNLIIYKYTFEEGPKIYEGTLRGKKVSVYDDTIIAYGKDGEEIFRTTVEEPVFERSQEHPNSI